MFPNRYSEKYSASQELIKTVCSNSNKFNIDTS